MRDCFFVGDITAQKEQRRRTDEFLALLAHELRNPLTPLRSGLQVIQMAGEDRQSVGQVCAVMERQVQHLVRLVDDLLDVSRISRGKLQLRRERIDLAEAVAHALEVYGGPVEQDGQELEVVLPEGPVYVEADKTRLAQVLCNLLSNAAKYSDRGSPIRLAVGRDGGEAVVSVQDAGVGIPPEMLAEVFEMFTQVDRSLERSQGGLGVGLAIAKRLVEMHGGSVEAKSEGVGRGSEFVIRRPVAPPAAPEDSAEGDAGPTGQTRRRTLRILVVDDNVSAAGSLAMMLRLMGHEVHTAQDGPEGIAATTELRPDVILLDIGMPRLNGFDAARHIREQPGAGR